MQAAIRSCITYPDKSTDILDPFALAPDQLSHVMALRGLLAHGLLVHALMKRHLVDFGVNK